MIELLFYGKLGHNAKEIWIDDREGEAYEIWLAMKASGWKCWAYLHTSSRFSGGPQHYCVADYDQWLKDCNDS